MPDRIRVLQVITRLVCGGAQRIVLDLAASLDPDEFDVVLATGTQEGSEGSLWDEARSLGITVVKVPHLVREVAPLQDYLAFRELRRLIAEERPQIVHAHTSKAGFLGCVAAARERVPGVVFSPHGHILGSGARIPGVPAQGLRRRVLAGLARYGARCADVVIAPNDHEREDGVQLDMWSLRQSVTVPNGTDTRRFVPWDRVEARRRLDSHLPSGTPCVGVVARLTEEKGVDVAIEALARMRRDVHLVIAGDGPQREPLAALVRRRGLAARVTFLGVVGAVERLLPGFDAIAIPSRTEAHGMIAAEALACEVPVVASAVGGLRGLVQSGTTGLLVQPDDPQALASALEELLDEPDRARNMGRAGRCFIEEMFSRDRMVQATERIYRHLAGARAAHTAAKPRVRVPA
ncbi:MAG: glycosyltransferase family 4 protein [Planctomycetota bacterium]